MAFILYSPLETYTSELKNEFLQASSKLKAIYRRKIATAMGDVCS